MNLAQIPILQNFLFWDCVAIKKYFLIQFFFSVSWEFAGLKNYICSEMMEFEITMEYFHLKVKVRATPSRK